MSDPLASMSTKITPQTAQAAPAQVPNNAGGWSFQITPKQQLERFLILGTWGGSYYVSEKDLTKENFDMLKKHVDVDGIGLVDTVVDVSVNGRAYKQQPTLFALAVAAKTGNDAVRAYALSKVSEVCRTGTMLYQFVSYCEQFGGWGRGTKRAIGKWYAERTPNSLANQLVKYRSRAFNKNSWTHRDLLRLAKPKINADNPVHDNVRWAVGKDFNEDNLAPMLKGFIKAAGTENVNEIISLIEEYNLPWEALPTQALNEAAVWEALVPHLGLTAVLRNLGKMGATGGLSNHSNFAKIVNERITDAGALKAARVHPMQVLLALNVYAAGHGIKGSNKWTPVPTVIDNLNDAFYASFGNLEPTNKRRMLALDVSGSMSWGFINNTFLTPRDATAALAMVALHQDPESYVCAFATTFTPLKFSAKMRLDGAIKEVSRLPMGGTDCSLPMVEALKGKMKVDSFEIYTDNETWAGRMHPFQALKQYRSQMDIPSKMVINGMMSNGFSIADPSDAGSLDVVGFDANTPSAIADFITS